MKTLLLTLIISLSVFAQDKPAADKKPSPAKRQSRAAEPPVPAEPTPAQVNALGAEIEKLRAASATPGDIIAPPAAGWKPTAPIVLNDTAKAATDLSSTWIGATNMPEAGRDGRVNFVFGAGLPVVVCSPLHVCVIELEMGEHITAEPALGDSVRWDLSPRSVGKEPAITTLVIVKPRAPGLDTNLVLTTDRRAYYLRLVSDANKYTARVGFEYPDQPKPEWQAEIAKRQVDRQKQELEVASIAPIESIQNSYFDYKVKLTKGKDKSLLPLRVFDDGKQTFLKMPPIIEHTEMPMLLIQPRIGKAEMVNYRVKADMFIVDRLFDHALLVSGTGKAIKQADIIRTTKLDAKTEVKTP